MRKFTAFVFSFLIVESAYAIPLPPIETSAERFHRLYSIPTETKDAYHYEGIVRLSNCSGSIVRFENSEDSDFAMILTNGHCVKLMGADEVYEHEPSTRKFTVLDDSANNIGTVQASEIIYGTMKKTDMAIYKLTSTYQQIRDQFYVEAFTLSKVAPAMDAHINIISGYWKKGYSCRTEAQIFSLKEADWTWSSSIRYSRPGCETIGGTSGSPVILEGSRTVVAVNNTGNEDDEECTMNNPCEIDEAGVVTHVKGYSYAQQIHWVYSCLNDKREIDTKVEGCALPKRPAPPVALPKPTLVSQR